MREAAGSRVALWVLLSCFFFLLSGFFCCGFVLQESQVHWSSATASSRSPTATRLAVCNEGCGWSATGDLVGDQLRAVFSIGKEALLL